MQRLAIPCLAAFSLAVAAWGLFAMTHGPKITIPEPQGAAKAPVSPRPRSSDPVPPELALLNVRPEPPAPPKKKTKPPIQDYAARTALSLVGVDASAEIVWKDAINNPLLPEQERQDLIEDLNEEGLPKTKDLTPAHLPLIEARLAIIARLMPDAMDKTNADAFAEARKDLLNMQAKLRP